MTSRAGILLVFAPALTLAACALRLGGAAPEELRVAVATIEQRSTAEAVGGWLRRLDADVAFLAVGTERRADRYTVTAGDSGWFARLAESARLHASGPAFDPSYARIGAPPETVPVGLSTLARWAAETDTSARFANGTAEAGTGMPFHHVRLLTRRENELELIIVNAPGHDVREEARRLMTYIATEVRHDAVVLLALRTYDRARADSLGMLLQPAFSSVARCEDQHELTAGIEPGALRLYYSPIVRVRCDAVRGFGSPFPALLARVVLNG
jgi:hypothetical protein